MIDSKHIELVELGSLKPGSLILVSQASKATGLVVETGNHIAIIPFTGETGSRLFSVQILPVKTDYKAMVVADWNLDVDVDDAKSPYNYDYHAGDLGISSEGFLFLATWSHSTYFFKQNGEEAKARSADLMLPCWRITVGSGADRQVIYERSPLP